MIYIGIDPGKRGGIAWLHVGSDGTSAHYYPIDDDDFNLAMKFAELAGISFAVIEQVHAMPKQGVKSMFSFGQSYGKLQMGLAANAIPHQYARPADWQKELGITRKRKEESKAQFKERLRQSARRLFSEQFFPEDCLWNETKTVQLQCCDALLIAEYARRIHA